MDSRLLVAVVTPHFANLRVGLEEKSVLCFQPVDHDIMLLPYVRRYGRGKEGTVPPEKVPLPICYSSPQQGKFLSWTTLTLLFSGQKRNSLSMLLLKSLIKTTLAPLLAALGLLFGSSFPNVPFRR